MKSRIAANADATAGQLRRLELEISATLLTQIARGCARDSVGLLSPRTAANAAVPEFSALVAGVGQGGQARRDPSRAASAGITPKGVSEASGGSCRVGPFPIATALLAPGMQYHRDKGADGGDQDGSRDRDANIGEVFRRRCCLKKRHLAVHARRHREIYGLSASRTLSFHVSLPPSRAISRLDLLNDGAQPILWL